MQQEQITQPTFETLDLSVNDHVAEVFLNRGDKANSMNVTMWRELQACFEWLDSEPTVRTVILAAHGNHFCAGIDLNMLMDVQGQNKDPARRAESFRRNVLVMQDNLSAMEKCRKPVLAAIHNTCIGGAMDMVTCADMRYATADAWFSIREVDIGMTADVGTLQRLPKIIPYGVACELAYTGRNMGADEAQSVGLVNRVFADKEALLEGARETAAMIASKAPLAVRGSKEMLLYSRDHSVQEGLNYIATWNAGMLSAQDLQEGLQAQMEKRAADYEN
ncbi:crotonase/enoyl-CoA hydratase family protein [Congregibacter sp.]|uniref:crotonase/enoyl-CoA hydratase family protein n=1 Tax=Congregibacter sp. TaxID=2744308 RepID=UPI003F6CDB24